MAKVVKIPITNIYADGDYTGIIYAGSKKSPVNVLLDTGSSTLAIEEKTFNPTSDPDSQITNLLQEVAYADNSSWVGAVVKTDITMGGLTLPKVNTAISFKQTKSMFGKYEGILGLAYSRLNTAYVMPGPTFPPKHPYNDVQDSHVDFITPYFDQLESSGLVANKFSMYTLRSQVSHATNDPATDPLNNGFLILGGGETNTELYSGDFQNVRVLDDEWYGTNLKTVVVGTNDPIQVPPSKKSSGNPTNSIIDSGTNSIVFDQWLFKAVKEAISKSVSPAMVTAFNNWAMPVSDFKPKDWPDITFILEGDNKKDVKLVMTPDSYWQTHAEKNGHAVLALDTSKDGMSILGLPIMNNYFMVFDRSLDKGLGSIKCASIKVPK